MSNLTSKRIANVGDLASACGKIVLRRVQIGLDVGDITTDGANPGGCFFTNGFQLYPRLLAQGIDDLRILLFPVGEGLFQGRDSAGLFLPGRCDKFLCVLRIGRRCSYTPLDEFQLHGKFGNSRSIGSADSLNLSLQLLRARVCSGTRRPVSIKLRSDQQCNPGSPGSYLIHWRHSLCPPTLSVKHLGCHQPMDDIYYVISYLRGT